MFQQRFHQMALTAMTVKLSKKSNMQQLKNASQT